MKRKLRIWFSVFTFFSSCTTIASWYRGSWKMEKINFLRSPSNKATRMQACKLAPHIGHLSGKFEGFDWQILNLTGYVDWALPLWREIKKYIFTYERQTLCPTKRAACQVKPCPWPDIWQAYRKKLFAGLRMCLAFWLFCARIMNCCNLCNYHWSQVHIHWK